MSDDVNQQPEANETGDQEGKSRPRILIGSQKDPDAYRPKRARDWTPIPGEEEIAAEPPAEKTAAAGPIVPSVVAPPVPVEEVRPVAPVIEPPKAAAPSPAVLDEEEDEDALVPPLPDSLSLDSLPDSVLSAEVEETFPPTNFRGRLSPDLEREFEDALGGMSMDDLLAGSEGVSKQPSLEVESRHTGRIVALRGDDVFIEMGGREQGVVSARAMPEPPQIGAVVQVIVKRFDQEEGLYELLVPNAARPVADWGDLAEGMMVDAKVVGHNSGGLECEVNHIRGFIPVSQVSLFRVEHMEEFVGQKFLCLVTEANPQRRNLVLSRRAVLEREKEDAKQKLLATLEPGQVFDGTVRKIMDFGAFVDIGGVDGLLHVSQLSWARVKHPSDVLQEGQAIKVRVNKVDPETGKISFGYRDMMESPWTNVAMKYPPQSVNRGVVSKIMEFGAFVQLEPGVEGLVHISELASRRVWRVSDVVQEGQEVEVLVQSVDAENQRISLSMRAIQAKPEPEKGKEKKDETGMAAPPPPPARKKPAAPLQGGLGRAAGGDQFGLKW